METLELLTAGLALQHLGYPLPSNYANEVRLCFKLLGLMGTYKKKWGKNKLFRTCYMQHLSESNKWNLLIMSPITALLIALWKMRWFFSNKNKLCLLHNKQDHTDFFIIVLCIIMNHLHRVLLGYFPQRKWLFFFIYFFYSCPFTCRVAQTGWTPSTHTWRLSWLESRH